MTFKLFSGRREIFLGVIYVSVLKLVTLTKSMTFEHSVKFFKTVWSVQYQLQ